MLFNVKILVPSPLKIQNKTSEIFTQHCVKSVQIRSFFWSVFSCIWTEYGDLRSKYPYSVRMQENTDQKKLRIWTIFTQCKENSLNILKKQYKMPFSNCVIVNCRTSRYQKEKSSFKLPTSNFIFASFMYILFFYLSFCCRLLLLLVSCVTCGITKVLAKRSRE